MKFKPLNEQWQQFLANLVIKFIALNKEQFGEQKSSILIKFFKGESLEKIANDEKLSTTRIRQLLPVAARKLEKVIENANVEKFESLKDICKGLEEENKSLRQTLKIHGLKEFTPLTKLNLSARSQKILDSMGITSIEQLCRVQIEDIMRERNAGIKTISEIENSLHKLGLRFGAD
jgi:hypothetical protein